MGHQTCDQFGQCIRIQAEIIKSGTSGYLLRGVVLSPAGVLDPGDVLILGDTISYVGEDASTQSGAANATWIHTHGIISPGLVNSHTHLAYDFLPEWNPDPPGLFSDRYQWAADPGYQDHVLPYTAHMSANSHFGPAADWGEIRCLVHGTTTVLGHPSSSSSQINWGVRNASRYHQLGYDHMMQRTASVRDITDDDAQALIEAFDDPTEPITRYVVHMSEGTSGQVLEEFDSFCGRDPRANRHQGVSLLYKETAVLNSGICLTDTQLDEVAATNSKIVWSPSANIKLYGETAPIQEILARGITTGIGPYMTVFGEDDLLAELRYAYQYGQDQGISGLTTRKLWEMATIDGAVVVGLQEHIGALEAGKKADIAVFSRSGADPYGEVINSRAEDVQLVLIGGEGYYGDTALKEIFQRNEHSESVDVCGVSKFICVKEDVSDAGLADTEVLLYNILEGIGYPPEEQYGRGNELLPLFSCD